MPLTETIRGRCKLGSGESEITYEELLKQFQNRYGYVRPLTLRCMELEAKVEGLTRMLNEASGVRQESPADLNHLRAAEEVE